MPEFILYKQNTETNASHRNQLSEQGSISHPISVPLFIIPGIFRNPVEMYALAEQLHKKYEGKRPIYIYSVGPEESGKANNTKALLNCLKEVVPLYKFDPYMLIGYSDGGNLAVQLAKTLQRYANDGFIKKNIKVCLLDSVPTEATVQYLSGVSIEAINNLVQILNYAATLAGFTAHLKEEDIKYQDLGFVSVESRVDLLAGKLCTLNTDATDTDKSKFEQFRNQVVELINSQSHIVDHSTTPSPYSEQRLGDDSVSHLPKLESVTVLHTSETLSRYNQINNAMWENHAQAVRHAPMGDDLISASHRGLLKGDNAKLLADLIDECFVQPYINGSEYYEKQSYFYQALSAECKLAHEQQSSNAQSDSDVDDDDHLNGQSIRSDSALLAPLPTAGAHEAGGMSSDSEMVHRATRSPTMSKHHATLLSPTRHQRSRRASSQNRNSLLPNQSQGI